VRLRVSYAISALAIFVVEVCIALFLHDGFIRPYVGDVLAVALVYCGVRAATPIGQWTAIALSFAIACGVELGQYFKILDLLHLRGNALARVVLGVGFELADFLAYSAGAALIIVAEVLRKRRPL
jgi:hypothetical protein